MSNQYYNDYVEHMRKLADVDNAIGVLTWDQEVNLPDKGASVRARQMSTLSGISYEIFTDSSLEELLKKLSDDGDGISDRQKRNISLTLRDLVKVKKLDKAFVMKRSQLISEGFHAWMAARKANDFKFFKKPLEEIVKIKREEAERMGYQEHPYDALMDEYEPEVKCSELDVLFGDVREQLVNFVEKIKGCEQVDDSFLYRFYPREKQWDFGIEILKKMGYDFQAGRQDLSEHPFTVNFSPQDVRVTTRIDENNFSLMTWSCIHEGGHALYEQGLPVEEYGLPLGRYLSLGIHESQSRLWENQVGRSVSFWKAEYPVLQKYFPIPLGQVQLEQFYQGINKIEPGLIRTEADELHYHFHILIRYEIEKALIEGSMQVDDLPEVWNAKYKEYIGLDIPDDKNGVLQDIHWAHGSFGYFPTYSLGSFYGAQFFARACSDIPELTGEIEKGNLRPLLEWLREKIHKHGRYYTAAQLCEKVTGEPLNFRYFMKYATEKFNDIYNL